MFTHAIHLDELIVAALVPPGEDVSAEFIPLQFDNSDYQFLSPVSKKGPDVHFAYSHSTTNTPQPHPSSGECLSPPLGGTLAGHFHLLWVQGQLRNAN